MDITAYDQLARRLAQQVAEWRLPCPECKGTGMEARIARTEGGLRRLWADEGFTEGRYKGIPFLYEDVPCGTEAEADDVHCSGSGWVPGVAEPGGVRSLHMEDIVYQAGVISGNCEFSSALEVLLSTMTALAEVLEAK